MGCLYFENRQSAKLSKKYQTLGFKVDFQCHEPFESAWKKNHLEKLDLAEHLIFIDLAQKYIRVALAHEMNAAVVVIVV